MLKPAAKLRAPKGQRSGEVNPYLLSVVRTFKPTLIAIFTFSFFINLLTLSVPIYLLQIYSKVIPSKHLDTLLYLTAIALVAILFLGLLEALRRSLLVKAGTRFEYMLSDHLLNSAIHRSLAKSYASVNVLRELSRIRNFISGYSPIPLLDLPWTPLFLFMLFVLHPYIGAVGVLGAIIMIGLAIFNEKSTRTLSEEANNASRSTIDEARSYVKNSHAVQAMGMQKNILPRWQSANVDSLNRGMEATGLHSRVASLSKSVRLCLQIAIICVAAWLIVTDELTAGATIASVLILRRAIAPLEGSIKSWKSVIASRQAFFNISEYLDHASTFDDPRPMPIPSGEIKGRNLSLRPSGHKKSLFSKADLTIKNGSITVLSGSTAAGKSTLLKVLCGIVQPTSGKVTLGGYELKQWDSQILGQHIGYLPQDVALLPGSVRENIARMADAPIDEVIAAAKLAQCHELIQQLPDGYETRISEDGQNLSGGQKQRIGLARAVYGDPVGVFLDEPDANLDSSGRSSLRKCLRSLKKKNMAVLLTTHHRNLKKIADLVYELDGGTLRVTKPALANPKKPDARKAVDPVPVVAEQAATGESATRRDLPHGSPLSLVRTRPTAVDIKSPAADTLTPEQRVDRALKQLAAIRQKNSESQ